MTAKVPTSPILLLDGTVDPRVVESLRYFSRLAEKRVARGDVDAAERSLHIVSGMRILLRRLGVYSAYATLLGAESDRAITLVRRARAQARRAARQQAAAHA